MDIRQRLTTAVKQRDNYYKESRGKSSKEELRRLLNKYIDTTMIGAIAKMEAYFGKDWGHGLKEEECTNEQLDLYDVWQQCRDEILNNGNAQKRAMNHELDLFDVQWSGYKKNFKT